MDRHRLLERLADEVAGQVGGHPLLVAIDGVDGAGKTVFADELAAVLKGAGVEVVRASVDGFHHPARRRYRRGRTSPEGFFLDSYDYDALTRLLLDPLRPGGSRRIVRAVHDVASDETIHAPAEVVGEDAVLVLDGIFLHRPELRGYWDLSVFLEVPFEVSIARGAARDGGDPDPDADVNHRYVEGQRLYLARCAPQEHATHVVDNTDLDHLRLISTPGAPKRSTGRA
jgi:uridine kinase